MKLPSEPPPTAAAVERRQPEPLGEPPRALEQRRRRRRSSGGRLRRRRSTCSDAPGSDGAQRAQRGVDPLLLGDGPRRGRRRAHDASAGTVLVAVPARVTVGVTVVPGSGRRSADDGQQLVGQLDGRVDALLGLEPGVRGAAGTRDAGTARRPCARSSARRRGLGSSTSAARRPARRPPRSARARSASRSPRRWSAARRRRRGRRARPARGAAAPRRPSCRSSPGPVAPPVAHRERPARERSQRPDGVEVAEQQHARRRRRTASAGARARRPRRARARRAEEARAASSSATSAHARQARRVRRRRLGLDERAQRVDHRRRARAQAVAGASPRRHLAAILAFAVRPAKPKFRRGACVDRPCRARETRGTIGRWRGRELDPRARGAATCASTPRRPRAAPPSGPGRRPRRSTRSPELDACSQLDLAHLGRRRRAEGADEPAARARRTPATSSPAPSSDGELVGVSFGFFGLDERELHLHSHITGVDRALQGRSLGFALKQFQRTLGARARRRHDRVDRRPARARERVLQPRQARRDDRRLPRRLLRPRSRTA